MFAAIPTRRLPPRFVALLIFGSALAVLPSVSAQPPWADRGDSGRRSGSSGRGGDDARSDGRRRGFDPSSFLERLDRNGNGQLDPDEQQGPARFLIRRLESQDSSIRAGSPIPLSRLTKAFEQMRRGRTSDDGDRDDRSRRRSSRRSDELDEPEPLVPGFGTENAPMLLPGFGPEADRFQVAVLPEDQDAARRAMRRYDRDRDGLLDGREISRGRFRGNEMAFDQNADGKLSERELAIRAAVRRQEDSSDDEDREQSDRNRQDESTASAEVDFGGRRSYRVFGPETPEGLPTFFRERDLDQDGQLVMSEYTSEWNQQRVEEFYTWDANRDGVITLAEVRRGVDQGAVASDAPAGSIASSTASTSSARADRGSVSGGTTSQQRSGGGASTMSADTEPADVEPPDARTLQYAQRILGRYDTNGDGALSATEWKSMPLSPAEADRDGDGRVTVQEYGWFINLRRARR